MEVTRSVPIYTNDESPGGGNIMGPSLNAVIKHNQNNPWNTIQTHIEHTFWQAEIRESRESWKVWRAADDSIPKSEYEWGSKTDCRDGTIDYIRSH